MISPKSLTLKECKTVRTSVNCNTGAWYLQKGLGFPILVFLMVCPSFGFSGTPSPKFLSFSPHFGKEGALLTVKGINIPTKTVVVLGNRTCKNVSVSKDHNQVTCNIPSGLNVRAYPVIVDTPNEHGLGSIRQRLGLFEVVR